MALVIGQPAPEFSLKNQHGEGVSLVQYRGKKNVVVLFYPFAFSSVCTGEMIEIRDNLADLKNDTSEIVAISCDSMFSLRAFADRDGLEFSLLSDFWPHGAVTQAYGIFDQESGRPARSTFIVDREGRLRWQVHSEVPQARDLGEYRKVLGDLA